MDDVRRRFEIQYAKATAPASGTITGLSTTPAAIELAMKTVLGTGLAADSAFPSIDILLWSVDSSSSSVGSKRS
jgi:hypothetical protein